jgi:hypothetical protein
MTTAETTFKPKPPKAVRVNDTRGFTHPTNGTHSYLRIDVTVEVTQVPPKRSIDVTRYEVRRDGVLIGHVSSFEGHSYRKAGRLITRTYTPTRWIHTLGNEWPNYRLGRDRRVDAIIDLILDRHIQSLKERASA